MPSWHASRAALLDAAEHHEAMAKHVMARLRAGYFVEGADASALEAARARIYRDAAEVATPEAAAWAAEQALKAGL